MDERIELAEWQGYERKTLYPHGFAKHGWYRPDGTFTQYIPDPENSDADCMELGRFLVSKGWRPEIKLSKRHSVRINRIGAPSNSGRWLRCNDYKQGVVELALKICRAEK